MFTQWKFTRPRPRVIEARHKQTGALVRLVRQGMPKKAPWLVTLTIGEYPETAPMGPDAPAFLWYLKELEKKAKCRRPRKKKTGRPKKTRPKMKEYKISLPPDLYDKVRAAGPDLVRKKLKAARF